MNFGRTLVNSEQPSTWYSINVIFVPFMIFFMGENWKWDYLWAFLYVLGAVFFVNREALMAS